MKKSPFLLVLASIWLVAMAAIGIQYASERRARADMLDAQLQTVNAYVLSQWPAVDRVAVPTLPDLRITVVSLTGRVLYDNRLSPLPRENHAARPEVREALATGRGRAVERLSASSGVEYFYSATRGRRVVARTAVPYDASLRAMYGRESAFFWFMAALTLVFSGMVVFWRRLALHEEREKIRIKKQLTNNINHEIKTPVAAIRLCMETLLAHPEMDESHRTGFIRRAAAHADRLTRLLADVGTIARLDDGAAQTPRQPLALSGVVETVLADERLRPEAAGFTLVNALPGDLMVTGNGELLYSLFRNLADNAIAYSEGNEFVIRLAARTPGACTVEVADNGRGVAPEHLPHLFERFYRVDKGRSRSMGGTGLGLSIVKNAVLFHRGIITVANRPTGGLLFRIELKTD